MSREPALRGGASRVRVLSLPAAVLAFVMSAALAALLGGVLFSIIARNAP
jgi:hypothetical protein